MPDTQQRDQQIFFERVRGDTVAGIGSRHGVSHQAVSQIVVRERNRHLDRLEMQLMVARREGQVVGLAVPNQAQDDRVLALRYFAWVLDALRARDLEIKVETRPTSEGLVLFLEDVTDYSSREDPHVSSER